MAKTRLPDKVERKTPLTRKTIPPAPPPAPKVEAKNEFEYTNRMVKAVKLFGPLFKAGITRDLAEEMSPAEWGDLARSVPGVNCPVSAETVEQVLILLEQNQYLNDQDVSKEPPCGRHRNVLTWSWILDPKVCVTLEKKGRHFVVRQYINGKVANESLPYAGEKKAKDVFEGIVENFCVNQKV